MHTSFPVRVLFMSVYSTFVGAFASMAADTLPAASTPHPLSETVSLRLVADVPAYPPRVVLNDDKEATFDLDMTLGKADLDVGLRIVHSNTGGYVTVRRTAQSPDLPELDISLGKASKGQHLPQGGEIVLGTIATPSSSSVTAPQANSTFDPAGDTLRIHAEYPGTIPDAARSTILSEQLVLTFTAAG